MSELIKLSNIGKVIEQQLLQVEIKTSQQLKQIGSKQVWLSIRAIDSSACYGRLCALEGAIQENRS